MTQVQAATVGRDRAAARGAGALDVAMDHVGAVGGVKPPLCPSWAGQRMTTTRCVTCRFYTPFGVRWFGTYVVYELVTRWSVEFLYALRREVVRNNLELAR